MEDLAREEKKKEFLKEALLLKKWLSLCRSRAKGKRKA
jgi:hypothetical protein